MRYASLHVLDGAKDAVGEVLARCQLDGQLGLNRVVAEALDWFRERQSLPIYAAAHQLQEREPPIAVFHLVESGNRTSVFSTYLEANHSPVAAHVKSWFEGTGYSVLTVDGMPDSIEISLFQDDSLRSLVFMGDRDGNGGPNRHFVEASVMSQLAGVPVSGLVDMMGTGRIDLICDWLADALDLPVNLADSDVVDGCDRFEAEELVFDL